MAFRPRWLWFTAAAVLGIAAVFAFDLTPWVRGGFGWRWQYDPLPFGQWLLPALLLTIYLIGAAILLKNQSRLRWTLMWSAAFSVALAIAVTAAHEGDAVYGLFARTVSKLATGPYWLSAQIDWSGGNWRDWTGIMREAGGHLSNLPPGLPMAYAALTDLFGKSPSVANAVSASLLPYQCHNFELLAYPPQTIASSLFGVLMPVWAALTVFPLASVAKRVSGLPAARWAVLWWPLTPALLAFAGSFNTIYPLATLWALLALISSLDASAVQRRLLWALMSGLISGIAIFANFAFSPLPLLLGLFAVIYGLGVRKLSLGALVILGISYGLGAVLPWFLFGLATGLTPLDLLRASFEFHLDLDRPYAFWAVMHIWDWLAWSGLGLAVLSLASAWRARRTLDGGTALSLALVICMVLVTLSGTARGETGRVWLVFTPLLVLSAADGLRRLSCGSLSWTVIAAVNGVMALVLSLSIPVVGIDLTPSPPLDTASATRPVDAQFFNENGEPIFRLAAWDTIPADEGVEVLLSFVPQRRLSEPYYLGGVLVLPGGSTLASLPQQPLNAAGEITPAPCWTPEQVTTVRFFQPVPPNAASEDAYVSVAVYGATSGAGPLTVRTALGEDTQIGLGPFAAPAD
jgi:hypothetical protein